MDTATLAESLFGDAPEATDAGAPSAAEPTATSVDSADVEEISIDEALAELDGSAAPQQESAPATSPDGEVEPVPPTPDVVAELQRQLDEYKAKEAAQQAAQADAEFVDRWESFKEQGYAFYDQQREQIKALGIQQGRNQDEIDLAIYRRVELGQGLTDPRTGAPILGEREWERQTLENEKRETVAYVSRKSAPSQMEQLATQYQLDQADRTTLARFVNYPPEAVAAIAEALGGKNQRVNQTQQQIVETAAQNVRQRLSQQIAPGAPGAAAPAKVLTFKGGVDARRETEYVAKRLGLITRGA